MQNGHHLCYNHFNSFVDHFWSFLFQMCQMFSILNDLHSNAHFKCLHWKWLLWKPVQNEGYLRDFTPFNDGQAREFTTPKKKKKTTGHVAQSRKVIIPSHFPHRHCCSLLSLSRFYCKLRPKLRWAPATASLLPRHSFSLTQTLHFFSPYLSLSLGPKVTASRDYPALAVMLPHAPYDELQMMTMGGKAAPQSPRCSNDNSELRVGRPW